MLLLNSYKVKTSDRHYGIMCKTDWLGIIRRDRMWGNGSYCVSDSDEGEKRLLYGGRGNIGHT